MSDIKSGFHRLLCDSWNNTVFLLPLLFNFLYCTCIFLSFIRDLTGIKNVNACFYHNDSKSWIRWKESFFPCNRQPTGLKRRFDYVAPLFEHKVKDIICLYIIVCLTVFIRYLCWRRVFFLTELLTRCSSLPFHWLVYIEKAIDSTVHLGFCPRKFQLHWNLPRKKSVTSRKITSPDKIGWGSKQRLRDRTLNDHITVLPYLDFLVISKSLNVKLALRGC